MLIEVIWDLARVPQWLGWLLLTAGLCTLAWMHGTRWR